MRRLTVLLALACASILTIGAAPASAANCTAVYAGTTYWNGQLNFQANVGGCTGINAVQFRNTVSTGAGWIDYSNGTFQRATYPTGDITIGGPPSMTGASLIYSRNAWCNGYVHQVETWFAWRIRNSNGNTWGNWYWDVSNRYNIIC